MGKARSAAFVMIISWLPGLAAWGQEAPPATLEAMWEIIQQQQKEIEKLQTQLDETDQKVEATGEMLEEQVSVSRAEPTTDKRTHIGGYGELKYRNLDSKEEIDFHRFVLYFGHEFNERIRFVSEAELEHALAGDGESGAFELEQAYVEFDLNPQHSTRGGLFLVPVGLLNETHEPTTFYGVDRNPVEKNIIPTTWWEGGASLLGELGPGWRYDVAFTSGLDVPVDGDEAFAIRPGRQKVSEARADSGALTGRLKWTGAPGLELAATAQYQDDVTQGDLGVSATLLESHIDYRRGPWGLRALYARWDLDGSVPESIGRDEQYGWYVEPSFRITPEWGAFARYNEWDTQAGNDATDSKNKQTNLGFNYWPHPSVVLKADLQYQDGAVDDDGFNLGLGYAF